MNLLGEFNQGVDAHWLYEIGIWSFLLIDLVNLPAI